MPTHRDRALARTPRRYDDLGLLLIVVVASGVLLDAAGVPTPSGVLAAFDDFLGTPVPSLFMGLVCIMIATIPVTLIHELGHAIAARKLLDTAVDVTVGSVGGIAQMQLGEISARARDILLIALAGPAASAIGLLVSKAALDAPAGGGFLHDLLWAMTFAGVLGVLNLIPFTCQMLRNGPILRSDGRLALDAARVLRTLR